MEGVVSKQQVHSIHACMWNTSEGGMQVVCLLILCTCGLARHYGANLATHFSFPYLLWALVLLTTGYNPSLPKALVFFFLVVIFVSNQTSFPHPAETTVSANLLFLRISLEELPVVQDIADSFLGVCSVHYRIFFYVITVTPKWTG